MKTYVSAVVVILQDPAMGSIVSCHPFGIKANNYDEALGKGQRIARRVGGHVLEASRANYPLARLHSSEAYVNHNSERCTITDPDDINFDTPAENADNIQEEA